jgi:hypothetical protein
MRGRASALIVFFLVAIAMLAKPSLADNAEETKGKLAIELNKLEPAENSCRSYFVIENGTAIDFVDLKLDLYIFNTEGIIDHRLALSIRPVQPHQTRVAIIDLPVECGRIGRLLSNGVLACRDHNGERTDCADLLEVRSRSAVPFLG